jgi:hypothetical protein
MVSSCRVFTTGVVDTRTVVRCALRTPRRRVTAVTSFRCRRGSCRLPSRACGRDRGVPVRPRCAAVPQDPQERTVLRTVYISPYYDKYPTSYIVYMCFRSFFQSTHRQAVAASASRTVSRLRGSRCCLLSWRGARQRHARHAWRGDSYIVIRAPKIRIINRTGHKMRRPTATDHSAQTHKQYRYRVRTPHTA